MKITNDPTQRNALNAKQAARRAAEQKLKCTTGQSELFPRPQCLNPITTYLFGDPYCSECYARQVEIHRKIHRIINSKPLR